MFDRLIWLVPAVVLALGLRRPHAGLLVLAAALPLFGSPPGGPYLAALDVAMLAAVATAWRAGRAPRSPLDLPVLAFVAVSLASMVPAVYHPPSWQPRALLGLIHALPGAQTWSALYAWRAAANLVLGWLLYLAVRRAFHRRPLRPLGLALAGGLAATLLLGLAARAGLVDLWAYRPIGGRLWDPRLHSLFFHSGWLAEFLVLATPFSLAAVVGARARKRFVAAALAAAAAIALVFTLQRGAWVALVAQLLCLAALWRSSPFPDVRRLRRVGAGVGALVLVLAAVTVARPELVSPVRQRLDDGLQLSGRWPVWQTSAAMVGERPLMGWGLGAFGPAFERQDSSSHALAVDWLTPHNHYLMTAAERGLLGLAAFGWLVWILVRCLRRGLRADPETRRLARGLTVGFVGLGLYGLVQYFFFLKMLEGLFWLLVGVTAALAPTARPSRPDRVPAALALVAVLAIPWRLATCEPIATASAGAYGFHRVEQSPAGEFAWTEGIAARRLAWEDEVLVLELANGHPRAGERPLEVTIRIDGRVRSRLTLRGGWEEHRILLGSPRRDSIVLGLEARPVFRPFREPPIDPAASRSRDIRQLGVALGGVRWEGGASAAPDARSR